MTDMNGNTEKLQTISKTESKVWKHQEDAGNTDFYCSVCQRMDGTLLGSMPHRPQYQEKPTEARDMKDRKV